MKKLGIFVVSILLCSFLTNQPFAQTSNSNALLLFGGNNHKVFLGCITCNKYDAASIWNSYGNYGSKYSNSSIWNEHGEYGSEYSSYSPWNPHGANPPIIVNNAGNSFGYFTVNQIKPNRTNIPELVELLDNYDKFKP